MARAKALRFIGEVKANGQPRAWIDGVPARDLDEAETAALTDEQYEAVTKTKPTPLYEAVAERKEPERKPAKGEGE